jgi:hypothetical protein
MHLRTSEPPKNGDDQKSFGTQVGHGNLLYSGRYSSNVWFLRLAIPY